MTTAVLLAAAVVLGAEPGRDDRKEVVLEQPEVTGKGWPRTLLHFRIRKPSGERLDDWTLVDASGRSTPFQLKDLDKDDAILSVYSDLPALGRLKFTFRPGGERAALPTQACAIQKASEGLTLSNGVIAVRWSSEGDAARSGAVGPFRGLKLSNGLSLGDSQFVREDGTPLIATGASTRIIARGPLYATLETVTRFADGGNHRLRVRVEAESPLIILEEEADLLGRCGAAKFRLNVEGGGWRPDACYTRAAYPLPVFDQQIADRLKQMHVDMPATGRRPGLRSWPIAADVADTPLAVWEWGGTTPSYAAFFDTQTDTARATWLAVMPLHAGRWRNAQGKPHLLAKPQGTGIAVETDLAPAPFPDSYTYSGEFERNTSPTMVRREWALVAGPTPPSLSSLDDWRLHHGYVSLDDYKEWILDWPESKLVSRPRLFLTAADVDELKTTMSANPHRDLPGKSSLFNNDPRLLRSSIDLALSSTRTNAQGSGFLWHILWRGAYPVSEIPWVGTYHQASYCSWTMAADEALASTRITPADRWRLRAGIAACAYAAASPEVNPRLSGIHQGTPNMAINRFGSLPFLSTLIPDHPVAADWLRQSAEYLKYKVATLSAPGGAWAEPGRYYGAAVPSMIQAAIVLHNNGYLTDFDARQVASLAECAASMATPPEPRFGTRAIPGLGHGSFMHDCSYELPAAWLIRTVDPAASAKLLWMWDQLGRPVAGGQGMEVHSLLVPALHREITAIDNSRVPQELLRSRLIPGYGAVLRSNAGGPLESCLLFRQGYLVSHSDPNQGDFVASSAGSLLSPLVLGHYTIEQANNDWGGAAGLYARRGDIYNRLRFGDPRFYGGIPSARPATGVDAPGGDVESNVDRFHAGEIADFVDAHSVYRSSAAWPNPGIVGPAPMADVRWRRRLMLVKGGGSRADYFILHDTWKSAALPRAWWHYRTSARPDSITRRGNAFDFDCGSGGRSSLVLLTPSNPPVEVIHGNGRSALLPNPNQRLGAPTTTPKETPDPLTVVQIRCEPASPEVFAVFFAGPPGKSSPRCTLERPGVVRVEHDDCVDYVFLRDDPTPWRNGNLQFDSKTGVVRKRGTQVQIDRVEQSDVLPSDMPVPPDLMTSGAGVVSGGSSRGVTIGDAGRFRAVLGAGAGRVGIGDRVLWGDGPLDVVVGDDSIEGMVDGRARMLYTPRLKKRGIPVAAINGDTRAVGSAIGRRALAVPLPEGKAIIRIHPAEPPEPLPEPRRTWGVQSSTPN